MTQNFMKRSSMSQSTDKRSRYESSKFEIFVTHFSKFESALERIGVHRFHMITEKDVYSTQSLMDILG